MARTASANQSDEYGCGDDDDDVDRALDSTPDCGLPPSKAQQRLVALTQVGFGAEHDNGTLSAAVQISVKVLTYHNK